MSVAEDQKPSPPVSKKNKQPASSQAVGSGETPPVPYATKPSETATLPGNIGLRETLGISNVVELFRKGGKFLWNKKIIMLPAIIFVISAFSLIRPFDLPSESATDDVGDIWNRSIARLGIDPVYPPQEDMYVGDIYLTLAVRDGAAIPPTAGSKTTFSGKWVTIGRADILKTFRQRPFEFSKRAGAAGSASEVPAIVSTSSPQQSDTPASSKASSAVDLYLTAFPGVDIKSQTKSEASWWQLTLGRKEAETEDISIPAVETYSIPETEAILALAKFCTSKNTADYCTDSVARKILGYTFGKDAYLKDDRGYIYDISVIIIRQVFVTQRLISQRYRGDGLSGELASAGDDEQKPAADSTTGGQTTTRNPGEQNGRYAVRHQDGFSSRVKFDQSFARPIVFGFRRVSFAIPALPTPQSKGK